MSRKDKVNQALRENSNIHMDTYIESKEYTSHEEAKQKIVEKLKTDESARKSAAEHFIKHAESINMEQIHEAIFQEIANELVKHEDLKQKLQLSGKEMEALFVKVKKITEKDANTTATVNATAVSTTTFDLLNNSSSDNSTFDLLNNSSSLDTSNHTDNNATYD